MKNLLLLFLILSASGVSIFAQARAGCFQNGGLKDNHVVRFESNGGKVTGLYSIVRGYDPAAEETYYFGGTRRGNFLTVGFSGYETDNPPSEVKKIVLTLIKSGDKETLRGKFYGARQTAIYSMDFEECEPGYSALFKNAGRVSFAKGANSATQAVKFQNRTERKAFLLAAKKGQTVSVEAPGCTISLYYPDKTPYGEGTAIDVFGMNLPQTGDYLFLIKPAGEPGACSVTFRITN